MTLLETQRKMAAALMLPLNSQDRVVRGRIAKEVANFLKPNARLTSLERLEIYSRSYWFRLLDSLRDDFTGLASILGASAFERLASAYLTDCPSRSFTLRDLGSRLELWLRDHPRYAGRNHRIAIDMARLEWAHIVAFDGPAGQTLQPEHLVELAPSLKAGVQPYISLLDLHYPVDDLRFSSHSDREGSASNTVLKRQRRSVNKPSQLSPKAIFLAVHRLDGRVYYRRLTAEQFRLLSALRAGRSIVGAINLSFKDSDVAEDEIPEFLKLWFATWTQLGWLTAPRV